MLPNWLLTSFFCHSMQGSLKHKGYGDMHFFCTNYFTFCSWHQQWSLEMKNGLFTKRRRSSAKGTCLFSFNRAKNLYFFFIAMTYVFEERWVNPDLNLFPLILSLALRLLYPITFTYFWFVETDIFSPYLCSFIQPLFHVAVYLSIHPFNLFFHIY